MLRALLATLIVVVATTAGRASTYAVTTVAGAFPGYDRSVDGVGLSARLHGDKPAIDRNGNLYFGDNSSCTIRRMSPDGTVTTVAGADGVPGLVDGRAQNARFNLPGAVAFDGAGNLYIADNGNNVIRKLTPAGVVSTLAGAPGTSAPVDGVGAAARFGSIIGLVASPAGYLVAYDSSVRKITFDGTVTTLYRDLSALFGLNVLVADLVVDASGAIYFADRGGYVRRIDAAGTTSTIAGHDSSRVRIDGVGAAAGFNELFSLTIDPDGNIWVSESGDIRRISPGGDVVTVLGQPDQWGASPLDGIGGSARVTLNPAEIVADASGVIWFVDNAGTMIRKVTAVGGDASPIVLRSPTTEGEFQNVGAGQTVSYAVTVAGSAPFQYQWFHDGTAMPGATANTLTFTARAADQGRYSVTVSNAAGSYATRPASLAVFTPAFEAMTTRHAVPGGAFLWAITSGAGRLVTVGTGGKILTSPDGVTWTPRESGTSAWLVGVGFGHGTFVAVGDEGTILWSKDAVTWTRAASAGTTRRLNNVVWGDGRFVAVGEGGAIVTSTDGDVWSAEASGVSTWLRGLVYLPLVPLGPGLHGDNGTGRFYAGGQNGVLLERSANGWARTSVWTGSFGADLEALAAMSGLMVPVPIGVGQDGRLIELSAYAMYSKGGEYYDGKLINSAWFLRAAYPLSIGLTARFRGLVTAAGAVFATGENGAIAIGQSTRGPWVFVPSGTTANLVSGTFFGNSFFVIGENETILQSQSLYLSRLTNISTRGRVGTDAEVLISGFVVKGPSPKKVLIRAAGHALTRYAVAGVLAAPVLKLYDADNHILAENRGWSSGPDSAAILQTAASVGAFPFDPGSGDSALMVTLPPGSYTAQVGGADATTGVALVEVYDADALTDEGSKTINISTRGAVGRGADQLIAGFVVNGTAARRVLIRAVGPGLAQFGLSGVLAAPQITLYDKSGLRQVARAWMQQLNSDDIITASSLVGAFPLETNSQDSAVVVMLQPGNYTVQVAGVNDSTGLALVEVYDLP